MPGPIRKLVRTLGLARDAATRRALLALFARRYNYPGIGLLRSMTAEWVGGEPVTLRLRGRADMSVTLRPRETGDVASFFENFIEAEHDLLGIGSPRRAVDAGAHIGCFSVWLHDRAPDAEVTAFEPNPENLPLLRRNFEDNRIRGDIRPSALWKETARLRFAAGASNDGAVSASGPGTEVPAESLADALGRAVREVDFVKMDIEGAEMQVLPGLLALLPRPCRMFLELHDAAANRGALDGLLRRRRWTGRRTSACGPHECWLLEAA